MCVRIERLNESFEYDADKCFYDQIKDANSVKIKYTNEDFDKIKNFVDLLEDGLSKGIVPLLNVDVDYQSYIEGYKINKETSLLTKQSEVNKLISMLVLFQLNLDNKLSDISSDINRISTYAQKKA